MDLPASMTTFVPGGAAAPTGPGWSGESLPASWTAPREQASRPGFGLALGDGFLLVLDGFFGVEAALGDGVQFGLGRLESHVGQIDQVGDGEAVGGGQFVQFVVDAGAQGAGRGPILSPHR